MSEAYNVFIPTEMDQQEWQLLVTYPQYLLLNLLGNLLEKTGKKGFVLHWVKMTDKSLTICCFLEELTLKNCFLSSVLSTMFMVTGLIPWHFNF